MDIEISDEVVLQRALGLRFDPITSETINIHDNTTRSPIVDARLIIKPSDTMESVKERLAIYHRHRSSIVESFKNNHRKFNLANSQDSNLLAEIDTFLGQKPISKAPRSIRIILAGLPGSGKSTIAEKMAEKYKCVVGKLMLNFMAYFSVSLESYTRGHFSWKGCRVFAISRAALF